MKKDAENRKWQSSVIESARRGDRYTSAKMVFDSLRIPLCVRAFYWQRRISSFSACGHGFFMAVHSTWRFISGIPYRLECFLRAIVILLYSTKRESPSIFAPRVYELLLWLFRAREQKIPFLAGNGSLSPAASGTNYCFPMFMTLFRFHNADITGRTTEARVPRTARGRMCARF